MSNDDRSATPPLEGTLSQEKGGTPPGREEDRPTPRAKPILSVTHPRRNILILKCESALPGRSENSLVKTPPPPWELGPSTPVPQAYLYLCPHRLCLGQGADIWAYVLQHVRSQR